MIQQVEVGNLTATTLLASDSGALKKWLEDNEYKVSKTQDVWFDHYIKKGWYLTAFKVNSKRKEIVTEAIRMSFKTSQPFNPYYVPKENWSKNSKLELFLICPVPLKGYVGRDQPWLPEPTSQKWMKEDDIQILSESLNLKRGDIPVKCQLTRYNDSDFAKGVNEDLFFHRT